MALQDVTMIKDVEFCHGSVFSGAYRVRKPNKRVASNGVPYMVCDLEDASGQLTAYAWSEAKIIDVHDLELVMLTGRIKRFNSTYIGDVLHAEKMENCCTNALYLIPRSICPLPSLLEQLIIVVEGIKNEALRQFVFSVLADDGIAFPFVSIPASKKHHHCIAGGLLEHSLECTIMASQYAKLGDDLMDLAVVGALFHDIGKIRTIKAVGKLSDLGRVIDHDSMTLEILAPYLKTLDHTCPDAAIALRYLWTWRSHKGSRSIPLSTLAEVVASADRISTGLNVEEEAFDKLPEWKNFATFNEKQLCWRSIMSNYLS